MYFMLVAAEEQEKTTLLVELAEMVEEEMEKVTMEIMPQLELPTLVVGEVELLKQAPKQVEKVL